jgi:hypothetical protein
MTSPFLTRTGAGCGAAFAVVLFVASGDGNQAFSASRAIAGLAALSLFFPFLACLCSRLRTAEGEEGWLVTTALVSGVAGMTIKIVSVVPDLVLHRAHIADGTRLHTVVSTFADAATILALYPLAVASAAVAVVALHTAVLPRWLAAGAAFTAVALAVNGAFLEASFVPALLLFLVWTLAASIYLLRIAWRPLGSVQTA